jgi:RNA polymerase sigma-70 factor (ECF subfamily)
MVIDFELQFKQLLIQQDELAFNEFYLQTVDIFFRYLKSNYFISEEDSNDIISDFYVKCWNGLTKYDSSQNFSGYIWSIFKNNLKDFFKRRGEIAFSSINSDNDESFGEVLEYPEDFTEILEISYTFEQIQQSMLLLDEVSQEMLFLKYIEEKSYPEIAKMLNISQDTARQRCSRALKQLKSQIEHKQN